MGRTPCCEKMVVKKGPWTKEEDQILINYINEYGHANWRAVPRNAGLLRCGKSCRLRWMNYLRPDIKRGHFTREEEAAIVKLHETFGNRWASIAARLPGRTDNEIKNMWHTRLKKRLHEFARPADDKVSDSLGIPENDNPLGILENDIPFNFAAAAQNDPATNFQPHSSSTAATTGAAAGSKNISEESAGLIVSGFPVGDDDQFWTQVNDTSEMSVGPDHNDKSGFEFNDLNPMENEVGGTSSGPQFWQDLLTWADDELLDFWN